MNCNVRYNTKQHLIKNGLVDENMVITNAMFFDENNKLSDLARTKYGVQNQGKLYTTKNINDKSVKAIENEAFFNELQRQHDLANSQFQFNSNEGPKTTELVLRALGERLSHRTGIAVTFINDPGQKFKGVIKYGRPIINLAYATLDTPIHEIIGHPLIRAIKYSISDKKTAFSQDEYDALIKQGYDEIGETDQEGYIIMGKRSELYNNLLKELETGTGKDVLERIKGSYGKYDNGLNISRFENNTIYVDDQVVATNVVRKGKTFSYTNVDGQVINTEYTQVTPLINSFRKPKRELKNLEEVQEEAIVELLGLMTANKLDNAKDGKLISLLKRLLKEIKLYIRTLLKQKEVDLSTLPDNLTVNDLADLLAYSNNKLILPGYEVVYTTPDNQKFTSYKAVNDYIAELSRQAESINNIDLDKIAIDFSLSEEKKQKIRDLRETIESYKKQLTDPEYLEKKAQELKRIQDKIDEIENKDLVFYDQETYLQQSDIEKYGFTEYSYVRTESSYSRQGQGAYTSILGEDYEGYYIHGYNTDKSLPQTKVVAISKAEAEAIWNKEYFSHKLSFKDKQELHRLKDKLQMTENDSQINFKIHNIEDEINNIRKDTSGIQGFLTKNSQYEKAKLVIEKWKKVNNIVYDPNEVYSRNQEFVSVIGAYSDLDLDLLLQNLLYHIEDNKTAGGEFVISAITRPADKRLGHMEGIGGKVRIKIYPKPEDIKWAANTDVYSGSVWDAAQKIAGSEKKPELIGVSYSKYPSSFNLGEVQPNLAYIIDRLRHYHNELGISLTGTNFRLEYDDDLNLVTKRLIDSVNSILDTRYGKLDIPKTTEVQTKKVIKYFVSDEPSILYDTIEEAQKIANNYSMIDQMHIYTVKQMAVEVALDPIPPKITEKDLVKSIEEINKEYSYLAGPDDYSDLTEKELDIELPSTFMYQGDMILANGGGWIMETEDGHVTSVTERVARLYFARTMRNTLSLQDQALVNMKVAKIKEVVKKHPRSLITSQVRRSMDPVTAVPIDMMMDPDELPFQKIPLKQQEESQPSSSKLTKKLEEFLKIIGVKVSKVDVITIDGVTYQDAKAVASMAKSLIEYTEGNEDKLTEEAMHFAVEILEQTNPKLFNKLFNKIGEYEIYDKVLDEYSENKKYLNADKTLNIRKIKKEAMGQLLADMYVKKVETEEKPETLGYVQSIWVQFTEWLKNLFSRANNPFEEAIEEIASNKIGTVENVTSLDEYFSLSTEEKKKQFNIDDFVKLLKATHDELTLVPDPKDPNSTVYMYRGKVVPKRVTDLIKEKVKNYTQTDWDKFKAAKGTAGHNDLNNIFKRYVDENGYLKLNSDPQTLPSELNPNDNKYYKALEEHLVERLKSYPAGTRFFSEIRIFNGVDTAGTIDFMAITKEGVVDMLDWKFIEIVGTDTSIKSYKVESYQIQMGAYKDMLSSTYGIPKGNFRFTGMIPIQMLYNRKRKDFSSFRIGKVDIAQETNTLLLPIASKDYTTGNKQIDILLDQLNEVVNRYRKNAEGNQDRTTFNTLADRYFTSMRVLQMQGKLNELFGITRASIKQMILDAAKFESVLSKNDLTPEETKEIVDRAVINRDISTVFKNYNRSLKSFIANLKVSDEEKKELRLSLDFIVGEADDLGSRYGDIIDTAAEKIAKVEDIVNIDRAERQLNMRDRMIRSFSRAQTRTAKLFFKLFNRAQQAAAFKTDKAITELKDLNQEIEEAARTRGMSTLDLFNKYLLRTTENGSVRLIDRFDGDIRKKLYKLLEEQDIKAINNFLKEYVDVEAYQKDYEERKAKEFEKIDNTIYHEDDYRNTEERTFRKAQYEEKYDITRATALTPNNTRIAYFFNDKVYSKEYQELKAITPLFKLYQKQVAANRRAAEQKMIDWKMIHSFVPNVRKKLVDRINQGGDMNFFRGIIDSVRVDPGADATFGATDPITRQPIMKIPINYVYELPEKEKSREILKNLAFWEKEINEYSYKVELESYANILLDVERRKDTLDEEGNEIPKQAENDTNTMYLKKFINYYLYNKTLGENSEDLRFTIDVKKTAERINKALGFKVLPEFEGEENVTISATKVVQAANRFFQMKVLGLNVSTAASNLVGGLSNAVINSGKYFTAAEFTKNASSLAGMMNVGGQGEIYARMIDYFMPLVENMDTQKINKLSSTKLGEHFTSEVLFALQRGSDKMVTYPMLIAMLENTTVIDGKLVNIREYVKEKNGYLQRVYLPTEERRELERKVENEIEQMKEKSVIKTAKIVDGQLVIDGIDRNSQTVWDLRNKIQALGKAVMGSSSAEDIAQYRMSLFGQTFMMFKNWIPNMALVRFGGLKENVGINDWEYGRLRLMAKLIIDNGLSSMKTFKDVLELNSDGVKYLEQVYQKKLDQFIKNNNDREEFLSKEEFMEIYQQGLRMAQKEVIFWLSMTGVVLGASAAIDTDEPEDEWKGFKRFNLRLLDKFKDEMSFFFLPTSFTDIANGSIFPALGTLTDAMTFMQHLGKNSAGWMLGIEEWEDGAKPMKYLFKTFPITKELLTYIAIFNQDLADEMGIRMSNQYSVR